MGGVENARRHRVLRLSLPAMKIICLEARGRPCADASAAFATTFQRGSASRRSAGAASTSTCGRAQSRRRAAARRTRPPPPPPPCRPRRRAAARLPPPPPSPRRRPRSSCTFWPHAGGSRSACGRRSRTGRTCAAPLRRSCPPPIPVPHGARKPTKPFKKPLPVVRLAHLEPHVAEAAGVAGVQP